MQLTLPPPDNSIVMAFDPGKANGYGMTNLPDRDWFVAGEADIDTVADVTTAVLQSLSPAALADSVMLIELFTVAGRPVGSSKTITVASESIGVLRRIATMYGVRVIGRQPNNRTLVTVGHLRGLGWHPRGKDHATQAARHLVSWLLTEGYVRVAI